MRKAQPLMVILLIMGVYAVSVAAQEPVYWSNPRHLGIGRVSPVIGALPNGRMVIASVAQSPANPSLGTLLLGIYDTSGNLIREVTVEQDVFVYAYPPNIDQLHRWLGFPPSVHLDISPDDKITVAYMGDTRGVFLKQYASDLTQLIDRTTVYATSSLDFDIATTPNGEIHTISQGLSDVTAVYSRFSSSGQPIGSPIAIQPSRGTGYMLEVEIERYAGNTVIIGYMRDDAPDGSLTFARTITDGILGTEWLVSTARRQCVLNRYEFSTCVNEGMSMAVDRSNTYFTWWNTGLAWRGSIWTWSVTVGKIDQIGSVLFERRIPRSGLQTIGIVGPQLISSIQTVVDQQHRKWFFWSERFPDFRGSNIFFELLGPNDEMLIDNKIATGTENEELSAVAIDSMGTPHVVFTDGVLRRFSAESTLPVSLHTKATTSTMNVIGDAAPGSTVTISFSSPANANKQYIMFIALNQGETLLGNGLVLPVQPDVMFFLGITNPQAFGLSRTQGTLDAGGNASVLFSVPSWTSTLPGLALYIGFVVYDNAIRHVSLAKRIWMRGGTG